MAVKWKVCGTEEMILMNGSFFYGVRAGLFSGSGLGCVGAVLTVLLVAGAMFGLVCLAWWGR
jgi:hypothetical protein